MSGINTRTQPRKPPRVRLPKRTGEALDRVTAADRAFFEANPSARWRVRRASPVEHEARMLVSLAAGDPMPFGHPWVLVVRAPECVDIRVRFGLSAGSLVDRPLSEVVRARPWLGPVLAAESNGAFVAALVAANGGAK